MLLLIPKKVEAVDIKDFNFVSLVGGVCKIISKVLVNRLTTVLEKVISNSQNAFNRGDILDLILIADECLNS